MIAKPWTPETIRDAHHLGRHGYSPALIALAIGINAVRVERLLGFDDIAGAPLVRQYGTDFCPLTMWIAQVMRHAFPQAAIMAEIGK